MLWKIHPRLGQLHCRILSAVILNWHLWLQENKPHCQQFSWLDLISSTRYYIQKLGQVLHPHPHFQPPPPHHTRKVECLSHETLLIPFHREWMYSGGYKLHVMKNSHNTWLINILSTLLSNWHLCHEENWFHLLMFIFFLYNLVNQHWVFNI